MIEEDLEKALEIVTERQGISREQIMGKCREVKISTGRHIVCWLMRYRGWSYLKIGAAMGSHHGTVINSCQRINEWIQVDRKFIEEWPELEGKQIVFQDSETRKENKRKLEEMVA